LLERSARAEVGVGEVGADLVYRAKAGDTGAREELINRLLPLVVRLARPYQTPGLEWEDLIQEGAIGLLRALASFDPEIGVPFPAYAVWWVRYGLQDLRGQFIRPLRLPPKALRRLAALKEAQERIYRQDQRNAGADELGRTVGLSLGDTEALLRADRRCRSLEESIEEGAEVGTLGELLADPLSEEAYEEVLSSVQADQLRALLTHLSGREQEVLAARYGLEGREEETLREVGDRLGISAERVRQLENRALAKLRQSA
jgi:RNA polymerase sigma factor (sigma-70 family)